jgi:hypothetical protein
MRGGVCIPAYRAKGGIIRDRVLAVKTAQKDVFCTRTCGKVVLIRPCAMLRTRRSLMMTLVCFRFAEVSSTKVLSWIIALAQRRCHMGRTFASSKVFRESPQDCRCLLQVSSRKQPKRNLACARDACSTGMTTKDPQSGTGPN